MSRYRRKLLVKNSERSTKWCYSYDCETGVIAVQRLSMLPSTRRAKGCHNINGHFAAHENFFFFFYRLLCCPYANQVLHPQQRNTTRLRLSRPHLTQPALTRPRLLVRVFPFALSYSAAPRGYIKIGRCESANTGGKSKLLRTCFALYFIAHDL